MKIIKPFLDKFLFLGLYRDFRKKYIYHRIAYSMFDFKITLPYELQLNQVLSLATIFFFPELAA